MPSTDNGETMFVQQQQQQLYMDRKGSQQGNLRHDDPNSKRDTIHDVFYLGYEDDQCHC
jgi:hypothetical protein